MKSLQNIYGYFLFSSIVRQQYVRCPTKSPLNLIFDLVRHALLHVGRRNAL